MTTASPDSMDIERLITPERVKREREIASKPAALSRLGALIGEADSALDPEEIAGRLSARERLGSTGLGHGVALPHARMEHIAAPVGALIRIDQGIDFEAFDKAPVDLLFALVVPEHFTDEHLQILAALAEMFSDAALCERLRSAEDDTVLYERLREWQTPAGGA